MIDLVTIKTDRRGKRTASVPLKEGEHVIIVKPGAFYQLGGQMDDVVPSHVLLDTSLVTWDHFSQKWIAS